MTRHTTFRFCLDPTPEQRETLRRHAGAARFAYNECLRIVRSALHQRGTNADAVVPWTRFDLINAFNQWKRSESAGRVWAVTSDGTTEMTSAGLAWREEVCQQVFEEAAVDCARALQAWAGTRAGSPEGRRTGFPRFKKKVGTPPSFRLRNSGRKGRRPCIRVGDDGPARSITLPRIGSIAVREDTRRLRRMIAKGRARILFATISHRAGRWWVSMNVEAVDLHPAHRHAARGNDDAGGWVGVDLGLTAFAVAARADGTEVARVSRQPRPLRSAMTRQRRLAKSLSRKQKGSNRRHQAVAKLHRHHNHIANVRKHFLHEVSNVLVKTHDRLVLEDLNVTGMLANHRLARAISDCGWSELARMVAYKQTWRGGHVVFADRFFPSSKMCARCGAVTRELRLAAIGSSRVHADTLTTVTATPPSTWRVGSPIHPRTSKREAGSTKPADSSAVGGAVCASIALGR